MPERANGKYVSQADAIREWWPAAREVLVATASEYGGWITETDLAARVQQRTGITTRQPSEEWIGRILTTLTADAQERGEPWLASLCVTAERRIRSDYPVPVGAAAGNATQRREQVAAEDRLACYRAFGAELPEDGGAPVVLAPVTAPRDRATRTRSAAPREKRLPKAEPAMREATCMNCFMVVPAAPSCRDCGEPLPA